MGLIDRLRKRKEVKNKLKLQGKSGFLTSFGHALDGINYTASKERNFKIETVMAVLVSIMGFILKISLIEWIIIVLTIGIILSLELVNTAIERSVDLVTKEYRELAKVAKDASAGAVLIMSMFSVVIGVLIFLPKIINLIK